MRALWIFLALVHLQINAQDRRGFFMPAQFAGSIGKLSAGTGMYFFRGKFESSLHYGFTPGQNTTPIHSITLKLAHFPFLIPVGERLRLLPLGTGVFFAQHFSKQLTTTWDPHYPQGYYWWPKNTRQHLFVSTGFKLNNDSGFWASSVFYFEVNTNDLYLYSYLPNTKSLRFGDILFFGTGVKLYLR
jgi:hypothetical protein